MDHLDDTETTDLIHIVLRFIKRALVRRVLVITGCGGMDLNATHEKTLLEDFIIKRVNAVLGTTGGIRECHIPLSTLLALVHMILNISERTRAACGTESWVLHRVHLHQRGNQTSRLQVEGEILRGMAVRTLSDLKKKWHESGGFPVMGKSGLAHCHDHIVTFKIYFPASQGAK
jgi:hypothetical protein